MEEQSVFFEEDYTSSLVANTLFLRNEANKGGAIHTISKSIMCDAGAIIVLEGNKAYQNGGGAFLQNSDVQAEKCRLIFIDNYSKHFGGAISFQNPDISSISVLSGEFTNNIAETGSAVYIKNLANVTFRYSNFKNNSMFILDSNVIF